VEEHVPNQALLADAVLQGNLPDFLADLVGQAKVN
jgi:hypothetical protein